MAYDHFIAQTYLRHFLCGSEQLRVYRKSGRPSRGYWPKSICGEIDGDLVSDFLENSSHIGEFRKLFEPHWNSALTALEARDMSADVKFVVAGFMSNLLGATPTSTRLTLESYRHHVIETVRAIKFSAGVAAKTIHSSPRPSRSLTQASSRSKSRPIGRVQQMPVTS